MSPAGRVAWWKSSSFVVRESTTCATSRSIFLVIDLSSSRAFRVQGSHLLRSTPSTPKVSVDTLSRYRPTPVSSSGRWTSRTSTSSKGFHRQFRSIRSQPHATPARRWARSPRFTTTSVCSTRASGCLIVRMMAPSSNGRPPSRSSTGCLNSPMAPGSRFWRRWCVVVRAPTTPCSPIWPPRVSPAPSSMANSTNSPTPSSSLVTSSTPSRLLSTGSCARTGSSDD
ncbi:unannotated protein [freshwater metagenome]|uniref:Unannotated protein n=1 Tax=freshwater metagenome TaxID=449393 RepID=A0A6J7KPA0_9ZZZZ